MSTKAETWRAIPDAEDYEASTRGRIRSWKAQRTDLPCPHILAATTWKGWEYVSIESKATAVWELLTKTFSPGELDCEMLEVPGFGDRERELTRFDLAEIRECEGIKPAHAVASDFRIDSARVRAIWDGLEA